MKDDDEEEEKVVEDDEDFISVCVGVTQWKTHDGLFYLEEDFKVSGEIWRVHKNDPDPLPSKPHAHCIAGADRFVGCKLHLGTRELFTPKNEPLGRYLFEKQFERLIELIRPKFPGLTLPLV